MVKIYIKRKRVFVYNYFNVFKQQKSINILNQMQDRHLEPLKFFLLFELWKENFQTFFLNESVGYQLAEYNYLKWNQRY